MIDIVPEKRVVKISATVDDDINLILDAIIKVDAAFILLVIPHGNDLINSPIGLKALRKKTYEKGKRMILVVPAGIAYELAKKAGFIATSAQESVTSDLWQTAMEQYDQQYHEQVGMNSRKKLPQELEHKVEYLDQKNGPLPAPEIITGGTRVNPPMVDDFTEQVGGQTSNRMPDPKQKVTGMDFSKMMKQGNFSSSSVTVPKKKQLPTISATLAPPQEINAFNPDIVPKKVGAALAKVGKKKEVSPFVKVVLFLIVALLIGVAGVSAMYYAYFTGIRVELFVQSYPETTSDKATATTAVTGFDVNRKEVQLTKEKVEKNATVSFKATKSGSQGTKATGKVDFKNTDVAAKTIPAGTLLVTGGKNFATTVAAIVPGKGAGTFGALQDIAVTAADIGEEYNVPNSAFTVTGFPTVTAENNAAFTGGTKRTFTVVGQEDVDAAVKALQTELEKQAVADLGAFADLDNGYAFIPSSIKTTIKDKPVVNPAVGAEVKTTDEDPTIALWITSTGLYYHEDSLFLLAEKLLLEKYKVEKTLGAADIALTTVEDNKVTIDKVNVDKNELVVVEFTAKGLMTSKIDTEKVKNDIVGKKWPEMLEIINKMPTLSKQKQPIVKFFPSWMPDSVRYVPKDISRIEVSVKSVETADVVPE